MKTLVYATCGFADPYLAILLDAADRAHKAGDDVVFAHCAAKSKMCIENPSGNVALCCLCRHCVKRFLNARKSWLKEIVPEDHAPAENLRFGFASVADVKRIEYRGCRIGYGAMSTYISLTRDCFPDFSNDRVHRYFESLLFEAVKITDRAYACFEAVKPDRLILYNGRLMESRSFQEVAKLLGIPFESKEVVGGFRTGQPFKSITYPNVLPHDVPYNTSLVDRLWKLPNESETEKTRKGEDFFIRRRGGRIAGDRVYIGGQKKGLLPSDWNPQNRNFVIFNSSEDEYAAIGPEFERYGLFHSQLDGIKYILEHTTDRNIHYYLRIHPNLMRIHYSYRDDLLKLPSLYDNVTVVDAADPCSTYDMMDAAEKVIVFGSTAGAEAAYWGKPVILLAASFYRELDITYNPVSMDELGTLLTARLEPKDRMSAIRYGYFVMNRDAVADDISSFDVGMCKVPFGRKSMLTCRYNTLLGSCALMKYCRVVLKYCFSRFGRMPLAVPAFRDHVVVR